MIFSIFKKNRCQKRVKVEKNVISFPSSVSSEVLKITLDDYTHDLGKLARAIDDYQYLCCMNAQACDKKDPLFSYLHHKTWVALSLLTKLKISVTYYKYNPEEGKKHLKKTMDEIFKFFDYVSLQESKLDVQKFVAGKKYTVSQGELEFQIRKDKEGHIEIFDDE